jgi:predicted lipoprotein with Yx(FWY)xxD motif
MKLLLIGLVLGGVFAGCGSSSAQDDPAPLDSTQPMAASSAASANVHGPKLKVISSDYGRILADGHRRALYLFTSDEGRTSDCYGDCATAWPPYIVKSKPTGVSGAKPGKAGTTRRNDGRLQATYGGHPVYYYVGDRSPGEVNCQAAVEFGGYWYVLRADGGAVH